MHQNNQKTQYNECLMCLEPLLKDVSFLHILKNYPLCLNCLQQFEIIDTIIPFHHYPLRILYYYNAFFQKLLFQYKGLYDYALKDAFLCLYHDELVKRYAQYIIIVTPSSLEDNQKRGFSPMEEIAKTFHTKIYTGLYKKEKYKQSDLGYEQRKKVIDKIGIHNGEELKGQKVLIIDDVITSGSTLKAILTLVLKYEPAKVELLVLSTKRTISELRLEGEGNLSF